MRDFHFVEDRANHVCADVAFIVECFEATPDAGVFVFDESGFLGGVGGGVGVDPFFDFDGAGAVVEAVGHVGGLGGDVADLADEGDLYVVGGFGVSLGRWLGGMGGWYLHYFDIVDAEFAFFVRLASFEDLFYGDWSEGFFAVCGLDR